jgi:hypothetical protein
VRGSRIPRRSAWQRTGFATSDERRATTETYDGQRSIGVLGHVATVVVIVPYFDLCKVLPRKDAVVLNTKMEMDATTPNK